VRRSLKCTVKTSLRIAVSISLLGWLVMSSDPQGIADALLDISPLAWVVAFGMYLASQVLSGLRWAILARTLDFSGQWTTYLGYYAVGMYFNLFLPTSVGGDFLKVFYLSRSESRRLRAAYSVLADRLIGLAAMFLLGAGAVMLHRGLLPARFSTVLLGAGGLTLFLLFALPRISRMISARWTEIGRRIDILLVFWKRPDCITSAVGLSLVLQALGMGAVALLAHDMGLPPPPSFYFAAFPLVAVLTLLPVSFNGIGIREGGFVYFLGLKGVPAEKALILSLSFFGIQVAASLIGGLAYLAGLHNRTLSAAPGPSGPGR